MSDSISSARAVIDQRLDQLRAVMTDDPLEVVTRNYHRWKGSTRDALSGLVLDAVVEGFEAACGIVDHTPGRRPTPLVFLDGAASRAFLMALKKQLGSDPLSVLAAPPPGPLAVDPLGGLREVLDLLERRLPHAFRGRPSEEGHLRAGFETLLAGAEVAYQLGGDEGPRGSRTPAPDFVFPDFGAALRLKLCDGRDREAAIAAEIHQEIQIFKSAYRRLVFAVCDLGFIRDPGRAFEAFASHERVLVRIVTLD